MRAIFTITVVTLPLCTPFFVSKSNRRAGSVVIMINPRIVITRSEVLWRIRDLLVHMALPLLQCFDLVFQELASMLGPLRVVLVCEIGRSRIDQFMTLVADTTRRRGKTALPIYGIALVVLVQVQNLTLALVSALRSCRQFTKL